MVAGKRYVTWCNVPLYPSEAEIAVLVLGPSRAREWPEIASVLEAKGLPKVDPLMGGRFLPAVEAYLYRRHDVGAVAPKADLSGEDLSWITNPRNRRTSKRR